jgi:hypothetical protein
MGRSRASIQLTAEQESGTIHPMLEGTPDMGTTVDDEQQSRREASLNNGLPQGMSIGDFSVSLI